LGNSSKSSQRPFEQYLKGIGDSLGDAGRGLGTFFSNTCRVADTFAKCPNKSGNPIGAFPIVSPANKKQGDSLRLSPTVVTTYFRHFLSLSSKHGVFIKLNQKSEM
jgi:hypothetical protein